MAGLLIGSYSCEDFVEKYPRDAIAEEEIVDNIKGLQSILNGLYDRLSAGTYNQREMNLAGELLADQMGIAEENAGRMIAHPTNVEGAGFGIWTRAYNDINRANTILYHIDGLDAEDQVNQVKGETHAIRAHLYFDLLRIYARPYMYQEPLVAGEPLGVVYKTMPFVGIDERTFEARGTIEEGYQLVLDDLYTALDYLEGDERFPHRFNEISVKANLARVYLYMGNWSEAVNYAEQVIAEAPVDLVDAEDGIDYIERVFASAPGGESIFELGFTDVADAPGMNTSVAGMATYYREEYFEGEGIEMPHIQIDYQAYGDVILRYDLVYNVLRPYEELGDVRGEEYGTYYLRPKGGQETYFQTKYHSHEGVANWDEYIIIRLSEMYFIAAEAYYEMEQIDQAEEMLMEVRRHRGIGDVSIQETIDEFDDVDDFMDLLLKEKRLEFFSEMSHRWFDLRRRGMDIPKGTEMDQGTPLVFEDYRIVERIPVSEIASNENMIQNPGY